MSGFLEGLIARGTGGSLPQAPLIEPRLPLLFEPAASVARADEEGDESFATQRRVALSPAPEQVVPPGRGQASPAAEVVEPAISAPENGPIALEAVREVVERVASMMHQTVRVQPAAKRAGPAARLPLRPANLATAPSLELTEEENHEAGSEAVVPALLPPPSAQASVHAPIVPRSVMSAVAPPLTTWHGAPPQHDEPPVINISIGRVEVRAVQAAPPSARARPNTPRLTFEDYVRKMGGRP